MSNLLKKPFTDLVFESRNKDFGAYMLRMIYDKHVLIALTLSASAFTLAVGIPFVVSKYFTEKKKVVIEEIRDIELEDIRLEQPVEEMPPPPPPPPVEVPKVNSVAFVEMVVKKDEEVRDTVIAKQKDFEDANPGETDQKGDKKGVAPVEPEPEPAPEKAEDMQVYSWAEETAEFEGGMPELKKYLIGSLSGKYTKEAIDAGISGKVVLEFVIEKDGSASDVKVLKGLGYGLDEVAMEAIKNMPKWKPAKQNQLPVRMKKQLAIPFQLIN